MESACTSRSCASHSAYVSVLPYLDAVSYTHLAVYSTERFIAVQSAEAEALPAPCPIEALFSKPLLVRESGSGSRNILEQYLKLNNYALTDFSKIIEVNSINALKAMARCV